MTRSARLGDLLSQSAERYPSRVALIGAAGGDVWTYAMLRQRASECAALLRNAGIRTGDRVGLVMRKSAEAVAALCGSLAAGAAYVPVDSAAPPQRAAAMFDDCGISALFVDEHLIGPLEDAWDRKLERVAAPAPGVLLVRPRPPERAPTRDEALAYVLYTSGSTGMPKGVALPHRAALSFLDWCSATFEPSQEDRFSSHAPFHFDLSILDLHLALKHGASVLLIDEECGRRPAELAGLIAQHRLTVWYSTPTVLRLLLEYGRLDSVRANSLRLVLFAGEAFVPKHLRRLQGLWPQPRYFNLYGPTETNVCTFYEVPREAGPEDDQPLPIGRPCSHARTRVVDPAGADVAGGEVGELVVAGPGVMAGYWNRPALDERAFLCDPDGTRWYRTGDQVREVGGEFRFLGRRDRMIKRYGYRVELDEVERALDQHPDIAEAATLALPDDEAGARIVAFVVAAREPAPSLIELKRFCSQRLPAYMIPDRFVVRGGLPRTTTAKIDYPALAREV